jgi:hypothetical protein
VLAASKDPNEIMAGGHFRVSVAPDGKTAEQVDALSRRLLILPKTPPGSETNKKLLYMTHLVSGTPVETHVFLSLLHRLPFLVVTGRDSAWTVNGDSISKVDLAAEAPQPAAPGPQDDKRPPTP